MSGGGRTEHAADAGAPVDTVAARLAAVIADLDAGADRAERIQALVDLAAAFEEVPPHVAARPFAADARVPGCESEAYVFASRRDDGTLDFRFAVQNPNGTTARALAVILDHVASGAPLEAVAEIDPDVVLDTVFGSELSAGKRIGLGGIVDRVRAIAVRELAARS